MPNNKSKYADIQQAIYKKHEIKAPMNRDKEFANAMLKEISQMIVEAIEMVEEKNNATP